MNKHQTTPGEMPGEADARETKALVLRAKALAALQEAAAIDGLKPFIVTHSHEYGASIYLVWASESLREENVNEALDCDYEPDRGEELCIDAPPLEDLVGLTPSRRLDEISSIQGK